ncbi:hypothetical protein J3R82DRAFT_2748 [Butyriboletus roseoflavus]|nr:hypothetical protein J3R82DRAFT_2748 [Butyriboletus roseoflavus]
MDPTEDGDESPTASDTPTGGRSSQSAVLASASYGSSPDILTTAENIDDDLPPPYTPAANVGEETVGLGPRRPFQQPLPIPPPPHHPPPDPRHQSNWLPPSAQPRWPPPMGSPSNSLFRMQPEPRLGLAPWQTQQQYRQRQIGGGGLLGMLFDTVREIADSVSGAHDASRANAGAYASPYSNTGTVYAPPSVPPPPPPPRPTSAPAALPATYGTG